jgi:CBS domain-containing protein
MSELRISSLPVVDSEGLLVGIITKADFISVLNADAATMAEEIRDLVSKKVDGDIRAGCLVDDVMTPDPATLRGDGSLHQAAESMRRQHIHQVVVTDEIGHVEGILTGADLVQIFH